MHNSYSNPKLEAKAQKIISELYAELVKLKVNVSVDESGTCINYADSSTTPVCYIQEGMAGSTWNRRRNGELEVKFPSIYRGSYGNTISSKRLGVESKDLQKKLIASVVERVESIKKYEEAEKLKDKALRDIIKEQKTLKKEFPTLSLAVKSMSETLDLQFTDLTPESARKILQALKDAGLDHEGNHV